MSYQSRVSHKGYTRVSPENGLVDPCSLEVVKQTIIRTPEGRLDTVRNKVYLHALGECALEPVGEMKVSSDQSVHQDVILDFFRTHRNIELLGGAAAKEATALAEINEQDRRLAELEPDDASVMVAIEAMGGAAAVVRQEVPQL